MATRRRLLEAIAAGTLSASIVASCATTMPRDEAAQAGKTPADFPETTVDYFQEVDGGVALTPDEAAGRNTWILWTGGNQAFWDYLANHSFGTLDLLKTADSRYRYRRFDYYGLTPTPRPRPRPTSTVFTWTSALSPTGWTPRFTAARPA
jgi:hypothetical protein